MQFYSPEPLLIAVIGTSPAVITETLFGLHQAKRAHPKHIRVITTSVGKSAFINSDMLGEDGKVNQFCRDYGLPEVDMSEDDIWVVKDDDNVALADVNTMAQHAALADLIIESVRSLTTAVTETEMVAKLPDELLASLEDELSEDEFTPELVREALETLHANRPGFLSLREQKRDGLSYFSAEYEKYQIHASIAGGRKSMTFLLGYAMSLFGRENDTLSHVLVSDPDVERSAEFFYPTISSQKHRIADKEVDFANVEVMLADIPLVKMSMNMPDDIRQSKMTYSETIKQFEKSRNVADIRFYPDCSRPGPRAQTEFKVVCSGEEVWLKTTYFATFWGWAEFHRPVGRNVSSGLALKIVECYLYLLGAKPEGQFADLASAARFIMSQDMLDYDEDFLFGKAKNLTMNEIVAKLEVLNPTERLRGGVMGKNTDRQRHRLVDALKKAFGKNFAEQHAPSKPKGEQHYVFPVGKDSIKVIYDK
ncbi:CRISPR-associated ring nuclease Csm6 [Alteromonas ponticola]|uniref:CRISPR-associated ring nuclease Csm6 n=1 Tax=Alteromonas aquimaris TaxID=2998417 RepID=A0ABT3P9Z2_9ALTE|nr:CRISPR-associated ring nuclease Csm6 [Alteromonas aquimaris]MCW8109601.1 CRISPR-associated ring nuclease Csm6 [Alteromonas aquimaris]